MTRQQYQEYLKSDHWRNLRKQKLSHSRRRCAICGSVERLEVHHLQYKNIFDVDLTDLRMLCHRCHSLFHELRATGRFEILKGSHHFLFGQTRHYVRAALGLVRPRRRDRSKGSKGMADGALPLRAVTGTRL